MRHPWAVSAKLLQAGRKETIDLSGPGVGGGRGYISGFEVSCVVELKIVVFMPFLGGKSEAFLKEKVGVVLGASDGGGQG
jgi:hypothetical protein